MRHVPSTTEKPFADSSSIQFNIVSKGLGSERMSFWLSEAASEIRDLLLPSMDASKAKL